MRVIEQLSEDEARNAEPDAGKFVKRLLDGAGLYLQATKGRDGVNRNWIFRYELDDERHDLGVGPLHTVTLADARRKAAEFRRLILDGIDPMQERIEAKRERLAKKAERVKTTTFEQCAEAYYKFITKAGKTRSTAGNGSRR